MGLSVVLKHHTLRLDTITVPCVVIVTAEPHVQRCAINRLFQKTALLLLNTFIG